MTATHAAAVCLPHRQGPPKREVSCIAVQAGSADVTGGLLHTRGHHIAGIHVQGSKSKASLTGVALCSCEASNGATVDDRASLDATDCCFLPDGPNGTAGGVDITDARVTLVRATNRYMLPVTWFLAQLHPAMIATALVSADALRDPTYAGAPEGLACAAAVSVPDYFRVPVVQSQLCAKHRFKLKEFSLFTVTMLSPNATCRCMDHPFHALLDCRSAVSCTTCSVQHRWRALQFLR